MLQVNVTRQAPSDLPILKSQASSSTDIRRLILIAPSSAACIGSRSSRLIHGDAVASSTDKRDVIFASSTEIRRRPLSYHPAPHPASSSPCSQDSDNRTLCASISHAQVQEDVQPGRRQLHQLRPHHVPGYPRYFTRSRRSIPLREGERERD